MPTPIPARARAGARAGGVRAARGPCAVLRSTPVRRTDYDSVAPRYDLRYRTTGLAGVEQALRVFVGDAGPVLEVGTGTGHWLARLGGPVSGLDPSTQMLAGARRKAPAALLVQGRAEELPYRDAAFARAFCINAIHHFGTRGRCVAEAVRVLRPGGGLLVVGLDPAAGLDRWWVYDHFPGTRERDRERHPPAAVLRGELATAGLERVKSWEAEHLHMQVTLAEARDRGLLDRAFASQLTVLTDEEYRRGLRRIERASALAEARGVPFLLETDLRLFATSGWRPA